MLIESFLEYLEYEKVYSSHTTVSYKNDLFQFKEFIDPVTEGDDCLLEVSGSLVRAWMVSLMDQGYEATSVNRKLSSLKSFYRFLVKNNYLKQSPTRKIVGPKTNKPIPYFVREEDMDALFDEMAKDDSYEGVRDKAILDTFYMTGMRCAELVGLKDWDVDYSAGLIRVTGKRNKQRLIPCSPVLKSSIEDYQKKRMEEVGRGENDSLFVRADGRMLTNSCVYEIVRKRLEEIPNLKKRSPHILRHTFATSMLNHGADLLAVKELLGHSTLASTEVYTHTTFEELKKAYHQAHPRA
ncbi:tyrosine-type recombinase/integrase [Bacteroidales bacterium OttesenSCG-928-J19]|nr:tyrosine-type recombinase/integrase [Bacteroidales bacterium OttesenSCG-928-J19]